MTVRLEQDWLGMEGDGDEGIGERYGALPDLRLMELARAAADLTEPARAALRAELERRGLEGPLVEGGGAVAEETVAEETVADAGTEDGEGEWVTVRAFRDLPEAIVARGVLEQAGIECALRDEHIVGINWTYSNVVGGVKLQVPAASAEAAEAVLSQPIAAEFATDEGEYVQPVCPRCRSLNVIADDLDRKIKLGSTLLNGLPMVIGLPALAFVKKGAWKCLNCECRWVDEAEGAAASGDEA